MTAKQRALEPPKLVIRDVTDSNRDGFESETFLESDPEPFTYAPVYSPAAARDATGVAAFVVQDVIIDLLRRENGGEPSTVETPIRTRRRFNRG